MTINAYAALEPKQSLTPFTYEGKTLGELDVKVEITHCGVCHSDVHIVDGDWGEHHPAVPGHEIIGVIKACGSRVTQFEVGQRVGIGWQASSCMECEWCVQGEENMCARSVRTCMGNYGGFADTIHADSRFCYAIPDALDSVNAAPLLCAGITVYAPLSRHVHSSQRIGVIGIGGLGHLGLQFARAMGCEVTAFSTSPDKEAEAREFGASKFVVSNNDDQMKSMRNSLDYILCTVNVQLDWKQYLRMLRPFGTLCLVGAIPGDMAFPSGYLGGSQRNVTGSAVGNRTAMNEMLDFSARHHIVAKTETMPMSEVNSALENVRNNQPRYRIVLEN